MNGRLGKFPHIVRKFHCHEKESIERNFRFCFQGILSKKLSTRTSCSPRFANNFGIRSDVELFSHPLLVSRNRSTDANTRKLDKKHDHSNSVPCGPLSNFRILDLTRILAGPYCTMILGDLGAEVIKVERPGTGDETRKWGPPFVGSESCYFLCVNRNKKSIAIDLKNDSGRDLVRNLAKKCDVLVENYVPGKLAEYGLGYEDLAETAPRLIYCSITGFGSTGPYKHRAGLDIIAASVGGLLNITGPKDGEPCKVGVAMTDLATALYAHGAILVALLERQQTGKGQKIDCNLLSTQVSLMANISSNYLNAGLEASRWGTAHESIVPYQSFKVQGGYITLGAVSDAQFQVLCKRLSLKHLLNDDKYRTNKDRVANREELLKHLCDRFLEKSLDEWLKVFEGSGLPYGPVNTMEKVFADPQVQHNKMVVEMEHSQVGTVHLTGPAVQFSSSSNNPRLPPPSLGQHTNEILQGVLGMSLKDIESLRAKSVIA